MDRGRSAAALATLTLVILALMPACGNQPPISTSPGRSNAASSPSPNPSGDLLFAVLEPGGDLTTMRNTEVAIVKPDGTAAAKAKLDPRQLPTIGDAQVVTQPEARVAAGKVFYADAGGRVRSLAPDGTTASVAAFPLTSQELFSFAVSPDGAQLVAALFSFPPVHNPPPQSPVDPPFGPGDFTLQVFGARAGQATTPIARRTWGQGQGGPLPRDGVLQVVGWSNEGPLATTDTPLGTQQGSLGRSMFGHVAALDAAGRPGPPIGGYSCYAWSVLADETVLCDEDGQLRNFSVRSRDGSVRFRLPAGGDQQYLDVKLAPDASRVVYRVNGGRPMVTAADGRSIALPAGFRPEGWLTPTTVIGVMQASAGDGDMAVVRLDKPTHAEDLGFKGFFVGVVQGG